jgi:hypothetical protein
LQHSRPWAARVAGDGTGGYVIEVEAILGEQEEYVSDSVHGGSDSDGGRQMEEQVMVLRCSVLWMCYSMCDCSWKRDSILRLDGAQQLIFDYERRLLAEERGNLSVSRVLCVGERVER